MHLPGLSILAQNQLELAPLLTEELFVDFTERYNLLVKCQLPAINANSESELTKIKR